ncbi:MAG: hypothetical protein AMS27_18100 [Bacteroides sp. SM23_62_1]|nr:MAG: hypothetical protein AMS27_18100 [Bacteroides sp. SM23_62_1]
MGANAIEIYRKNSCKIECTVSGLPSLSGYTGKLTAKVNKDDTEKVIDKTGDIVEFVITFNLTPSDTDKPYKIYHYDVVIDDSTNEYTVVQDLLEIKKSVSN